MQTTLHVETTPTWCVVSVQQRCSRCLSAILMDVTDVNTFRYSFTSERDRRTLAAQFPQWKRADFTKWHDSDSRSWILYFNVPLQWNCMKLAEPSKCGRLSADASALVQCIHLYSVTLANLCCFFYEEHFKKR